MFCVKWESERWTWHVEALPVITQATNDEQFIMNESKKISNMTGVHVCERLSDTQYLTFSYSINDL
jgi:hypothetical protein